MATVSDHLVYLNETKSLIKAAIEAKGVEVASDATFRSYAASIADITAGVAASEFPDMEAILEADTGESYPYKMLWVMDDSASVFDYTFGSNVAKIKLSDGYTSTASFKDHVWGDNTDSTSNDYHWMILYSNTSSTYQKDTRPMGIAYSDNFIASKTDGSSMFYFCSSLVELPAMDLSSMSSLFNMFYKCTTLKTIPAMNTAGVQSMSNMFNGCAALVHLPSLDTASCTAFSNAFDGCNSLVDIDTTTGWDLYVSISFKDSPALSKTTALALIDKLATTTGQTITFDTSTYAKLSAAEIAVATDKGWAVASA
jgi:hypothetical protein